MIYLCISSLPDRFSAERAALSLKSSFCGKQNTEYIDRIASRVPSAAEEGLYALEILAKMLKECFPDESFEKIVLRRHESGKPYLEGSSLKFSLSHSCGKVACAISDNGEVGVDIEAGEIAPARADGIAARFFSKDEVLRLSGDTEAFRREWTRKEAAAKMLNLPLSEYLKACKSGNCSNCHAAYYFEFTEHGIPVTVCTGNPQNTVKRVTVNTNS